MQLIWASEWAQCGNDSESKTDLISARSLVFLDPVVPLGYTQSAGVVFGKMAGKNRRKNMRGSGERKEIEVDTITRPPMGPLSSEFAGISSVCRAHHILFHREALLGL